MINLEIRERENIAIATPDDEITATDVETCADAINTYINIHDRVPNLVLHATSFPHWKNFHALTTHLEFVKDHHKLIEKVALVSDSKLLALLRPIVDHFTGAKVRRFPEAAIDDAMNWAEMEEDHPGEFIIIDGLPDDVLAIDARGLITSKDYNDTLSPLIEANLEQHDKLKLLCVAGSYFDGYSAGAMWDDVKLGLHHYTDFAKIALVSDVEWLRHSAKFFGPLMPGEMMVFSLDELDDAKEWITS